MKSTRSRVCACLSLLLILAAFSTVSNAQWRGSQPGQPSGQGIPGSDAAGGRGLGGINRRDPVSAENYVDVTIVGAGGADLPKLVHVEMRSDGQEMESRYYRDGYADTKGHVTFGSVPDGSYRITASAPGYMPHYIDIRCSHGERLEARLEISPAVDVAEYTPEAGSVSVGWLSVPEKARKDFEKAHERYLKQDFNGSIKLLKQALAIDSNFAYAYNQLGLDYWSLQRIPDAKESFQRAIATDDKFLQAPLNLADMLISQKQYAEAAATLQQANQKHPDRGEPYYLMAKLHFTLGNLIAPRRPAGRP